MFRSKALRKQSSPDRLDALSQVVRPSSWWLLGALGVGLVLVVVWAVTWRIPISVESEGILLVPRRVVPLQAPAEGVVAEIRVRAGDTVQEGEILGWLKIAELELLVAQAEAEKSSLEERNAQLANLEAGMEQKIKDSLLTQKSILAGAREKLTEFERSGTEDVRKHLDAQNALLVEALNSAQELDKLYGTLQTNVQKLLEDQGETVTALLAIKADRTRNTLAAGSLRRTQEELKLQSLQDERSRTELRLRGIELGTRIAEIDGRLEQLALDFELARVRREGDVLGCDRRIRALMQTMAERGEISSPAGGKLVEITVAAGERVQAGQRIGRLDRDSDASLEALLFFPVAEGKKIRPDMEILITPSTVEQQRAGSIRGRVREVSLYAVSTDAAASEVGDRELARTLAGGGNRSMVRATLEVEDGEFVWTGRSPGVPVTPGTTARGRIVVERVRPIDMLLGVASSVVGND